MTDELLDTALTAVNFLVGSGAEDGVIFSGAGTAERSLRYRTHDPHNAVYVACGSEANTGALRHSAHDLST